MKPIRKRLKGMFDQSCIICIYLKFDVTQHFPLVVMEMHCRCFQPSVICIFYVIDVSSVDLQFHGLTKVIISDMTKDIPCAVRILKLRVVILVTSKPTHLFLCARWGESRHPKKNVFRKIFDNQALQLIFQSLNCLSMPWQGTKWGQKHKAITPMDYRFYINTSIFFHCKSQ